jgi:serine/threonine protein kinase
MTSSATLLGQKVGEYEVVARLGTGGMGAVYEGRHPIIKKRVAIKVLLPQFSQDKDANKRFIDEARAVNEIRHRGIVDIFAFGQLGDGSHYLVMEFLQGNNLAALLESRGKLPPIEALALVEEVLDAVAAAHHAHVIHRDLKPQNIFLVDTGQGRPYVKLLDFGVAKLTDGDGETRGGSTGVIGTPIYMPPEQVRGHKLGPATDIYALGVVLFELLAGRPPFQADNAVAMMGRHLEAAPPRVSMFLPGIPHDLDMLVDRMLAKRPEDRPQDAEELRAELVKIRSRLELPQRTASEQLSTIDEEVGPTFVRPAHPTFEPGQGPTDPIVSSPSFIAADRQHLSAQSVPTVTDVERSEENAPAPRPSGPKARNVNPTRGARESAVFGARGGSIVYIVAGVLGFGLVLLMWKFLG